MTKRKLVTLSMQPEDVKILEAVAVEVGLSKSELIRRLLKKISYDDKLKHIIKRGYVITSHNVHSGKQGTFADEIEHFKSLGDQPKADSSSLESTRILPQEEEELKRMIEISKIRWIDED